MSSETAQKGKKKRVRKLYDHSLPPPEVSEYQRQNFNKNKVKDINLKRLENYMWTKPTLEMTALFFGVSIETIETTIKQHYALSFPEFREQRIQYSRHALVQECMAQALEAKEFRALKFALQNLAGWSESVQVSAGSNNSIQLKYSLDKPPENILDVTPATTNVVEANADLTTPVVDKK